MGRKLSSEGQIGLFGTSIAGTWLFAELEGAVSFFVDEDPQRVGKRWQGRPVYDPRHIPPGSRLMVPLPVALAESIFRRIARPDLEICLPPGIGMSRIERGPPPRPRPPARPVRRAPASERR